MLGRLRDSFASFSLLPCCYSLRIRLRFHEVIYLRLQVLGERIEGGEVIHDITGIIIDIPSEHDGLFFSYEDLRHVIIFLAVQWGFLRFWLASPLSHRLSDTDPLHVILGPSVHHCLPLHVEYLDLSVFLAWFHQFALRRQAFHIHGFHVTGSRLLEHLDFLGRSDPLLVARKYPCHPVTTGSYKVAVWKGLNCPDNGGVRNSLHVLPIRGPDLHIRSIIARDHLVGIGNTA
mmetsp:Transcript_1616/g.2323  ORF Transcript_1616/g.2323 Transcript_1616/m.2323 type:complete len:232 (-) Transcript_1616:650-1345(-)